MVELEWSELLLRLGTAVALGAAIGFERESRSKVAGLRTHALVSVGAALFTMAGAYGFEDVDRSVNVDPARLAAQVASGIGFIGAGAIIRHGTDVRGVTTAATLWAAAAVGVGAGAGFIAGTVIAAALVLAVLIIFRAVAPLARRDDRRRMRLEIEYERGHGTMGPLFRGIEDIGSIEQVDVDDGGADVTQPGPRRLTIMLLVDHPAALEALRQSMLSRPEVAELVVEHQ